MSSDVISSIMAVTANHRLMSQKDKGKFIAFSSNCYVVEPCFVLLSFLFFVVP